MIMRPVLIGACLAALAACSAPVSPVGSQSVAAPAGQSPATGAQIAYRNQPVVLSSDPALSTTGSSVSVRFQVASDAQFANLVSQTDVTPSAGQRPSVTLATLTASRTYYWRVVPVLGDSLGAPGPTAFFTVGPQVELGTPIPVSPLTGASGLEQRPSLTVLNVTKTGPVGTVLYRFDISLNSSFSPVLMTGTVGEGQNRTTFTPTSDLPSETVFFWRAQAFDALNSVSGSYSATQSGTTYFSIDLTKVNYQKFVNVSAWPETNRIIAVEQDGGGNGPMCINHTKRGLWPASNFFDDPNVPIEGNQWYLARINGQWYAGSGEWLRVGQICKSGQTSEAIGPDGTWGGPMDTWVPKRGEPVGYMLTTPARFYPQFRTTDERSNVVVQPWMVNGINTPAGIR